MTFFSIIRFQSMLLISRKNSIMMILLFSLYSISSIATSEVDVSLSESIYTFFSISRMSLLDLFRTLLFVLSFITICTYFIENEVSSKNSYVLLRIKSTKVHFHGLFITMILYIFVFVLVSYLVIILVYFIFHSIDAVSIDLGILTDNYVLLQQYILISLSIVMLVLLDYLFLLLVKKIENAIILIIILWTSSFFYLASHINQSMYIPFLYGFFESIMNTENSNYLLKIGIACISNIILYILCYLINQRRNHIFS